LENLSQQSGSLDDPPQGLKPLCNPPQGLRILECGHTFHEECINDWLDRVPTCPMCRGKVDDEDVGVEDMARRLAIHRYIRKLKLVQIVAITDVFTSGINIMVNPLCCFTHSMVDFMCAMWGYWGAYNLNINYLIMYGISRLCMVGIIGYKMVIIARDDVQRMLDAIYIVYVCMCVFYIYIGYLTYILSRDVEIYRSDVLPLLRVRENVV